MLLLINLKIPCHQLMNTEQVARERMLRYGETTYNQDLLRDINPISTTVFGFAMTEPA